MHKLKNYLKKPEILLLIAILLIAVFFRTYKLIEWFDFAHDGDLYSWIAKDIVVNKHLRLSGQETSAPGIFIGPLYYYLNIPFFLLTNMDPIGALIPITLMGILAVFSYYYVFAKLFNNKIGLIASFIYATSLYIVDFDRRVVPSTPTNLWVIWYLFAILNIAKGNFKFLPLLGILIGLIWHIHIALAPALIAIPLSIFFAKKLPSFKQTTIFLLITFITSLPFITFEARHGYSQTKNLINNFTASFSSGNIISEPRKVFLGSKNDNAALNLNQSSKFLLEVEPQTPIAGDKIKLKVTTKNPKYSTTIVYMDCGDPRRFEIGYITAEFPWSTEGCNEGEHKITATARIPVEPKWKTNFNKFLVVLEKENRNINSLFISPFETSQNFQYLVTLFFLTTPLICWKLKLFSGKQTTIFYSWIIGVFLFFTFSSIIVSEYYLASTDTIIILSTSALLYKLTQVKRLWFYLICLLLIASLFKNFYYFINRESYNKGYLERKSIAQFIAKDAKEKGFPCVAVSYITTPGENVGFRYFFWLYNLKTAKPGNDAPVYNIVIPDELALGKIDQKYGHIGVIVPENIGSKDEIEKSCQGEDTNFTDSMFGFTK